MSKRGPSSSCSKNCWAPRHSEFFAHSSCSRRSIRATSRTSTSACSRRTRNNAVAATGSACSPPTSPRSTQRACRRTSKPATLRTCRSTSDTASGSSARSICRTEVHACTRCGGSERRSRDRMLIREATDDDWPAIFPIFDAIVSDGTTYAYPEGLSSDEAKALWMPGAPSRTVVAVDDEMVVGTATMGPNRPGRGSHIATASFMVNPTTRSRGVGRALGNDMVEWAAAQGYRGIQFNAVVETNHAAVHLWQALGFEIIGTVPEAFHHANGSYVGLHVMFRRLH